jgi:hypothetical protein
VRATLNLLENMIDEFRQWLETQIAVLADTEGYYQDDWIVAQRLIDDARERAYALRLPQTAAAATHGPPRQRLCEILATLPAPEYLDIREVADLLRVSVRTVRRGVITGEIPRPDTTINTVERWHRSNFNG